MYLPRGFYVNTRYIPAKFEPKLKLVFTTDKYLGKYLAGIYLPR